MKWLQILFQLTVVFCLCCAAGFSASIGLAFLIYDGIGVISGFLWMLMANYIADAALEEMKGVYLW